jgi:hypothetical protein
MEGTKKYTRGTYKRIKQKNENGVVKYKRGTYCKRTDDDGNEIKSCNSRSLITCPERNDDGTLCCNLSFRHGYCSIHQHKLPIWKQLQGFVCEMCNDKIKIKTESKTLCTKCILIVGQKCIKCNLGTINFDTGECNKHETSMICSTVGCTVIAHHGNEHNRYCTRHNPVKKCTYSGYKQCTKTKRVGDDYCNSHGGGRVILQEHKDTTGGCKKMLVDGCMQRIPRFRKSDADRIIDSTKCQIHGGMTKCFACDKKACVGFNGTCEDHGGTTCVKCSGPLYINNKNKSCHVCVKADKNIYDKM